MRAPVCAFRAESFELEGRLLLANGHASIPDRQTVEFRGTAISPLMLRLRK